MDVISDKVLEEQLDVLLAQINYQIWTIEKDAKAQNVDVYSMRHPDGHYVMADLLTAKAQTAAALVALRRR